MNNMAKLSEYESRKRSYGIAYLLWILGGFIGAQRFYTDNPIMGILWVLFTVTTLSNPSHWFTAYLAVCLVEWVAIGLRVKEINQEALVWLKHSDENGNLNPQNNHPTSV